MRYFENYSSNTIAGSANQLYFYMPAGEVRTGRVFYKISTAGEYAYSLLFSNIMDSTFARGDVSYKNLICDQWQIHGARLGKCHSMSVYKPICEMTMDDGSDADIVVTDLQEITFAGSKSKTVAPGEFFSSDPLRMSFQKGEYLCLEMTFSGNRIPYHEECLLPIYMKKDGVWSYSNQMPVAGMIGCDRPVAARIGYAGDSITQGVGTPLNSYLHWTAKLSEKLPEKYACWNLGIGYGRTNDFASDGAWFYKAKQNDILFVCYGVNDISQGFAEEQIKSDLTSIVRRLKQLNKTVILQTIPPFDYEGSDIEKWKRLNQYIKKELAEEVDLVFDVVPYLAISEADPQMTKYGDHPDEEGCAVWAAALYDQVKTILE